MTPQDIANALTEGVGIAMDKDRKWKSYDSEPEVDEDYDGVFLDGYIHDIGEGIEIDYSGDWEDSWTPKLFQGEQDALDMIEGEKALLKQELCSVRVPRYSKPVGAVGVIDPLCNKPLPCPDHPPAPTNSQPLTQKTPCDMPMQLTRDEIEWVRSHKELK